MGPLKNYARTQKHDLRTNRTHENALTNSPRSQPSISLEDHAAMDVAPATTKDNNTGSNDTPLSPNSQQLLDSIKSTINQDSFGSIEASDYVLDFEETSLEFFTGSENPQDEGNSTSQDEGYCTSGSTSGKSSPTGSFGEDQPAANMEILQTENGLNETNASATVPEEIIHNGDIFIQEANINPSLEDLSSAADMFVNNNMENLMVMNVDQNQDAGGLQTLDLGAIMKDSTNIQFVVVDEDSTAVAAAGQEFTLIGTYDNIPEMIQANPSLSSEKEKVDGKGSKREPRRHTKGPKKADLSEIPEENRGNVLRCRKYRENKNIKIANWEDELKEQEKEMMEKLAKVQGAYINLIKGGRIKCV